MKTIKRANVKFKDKPVSKKVAQKLKYAEKNWPSNLERYEHREKILQGRNSYAKTDHDAMFMRMKEDHMLNGQLKPGYNWQISTNNQFILNYSIHQSSTDYNTLPAHVKQFAVLYGMMPEIATADAGYGSEKSYMFLEEHDITTYVKDTYFDKDRSDNTGHHG